MIMWMAIEETNLRIGREVYRRSNVRDLNQKLRMLEKSGPDLPPQLLAGPIKHYAHIYKMKINGQVALRPLLCRGPIRNDEEFTMLKGATEVGWKWNPSNAPVIATERRQEVMDNPSHRRCNHVRVE